VFSLLKNSLEKGTRERKVSFPSGTDTQSALKRCIERVANKLRKATKNKKQRNLHEKRRSIGMLRRKQFQEGLHQRLLSTSQSFLCH